MRRYLTPLVPLVLRVSRFTTSLIKLVPTAWGPPTFEIDGIKMLPTARVSPYADAERKVSLIEPRGKRILDTCGGLGYFAAWCLQGQARQVLSYEKNPDVIWLHRLNPWSPEAGNGLNLTQGDITEQIVLMPDATEVATRLRRAGFITEMNGDGVLARKN